MSAAGPRGRGRLRGWGLTTTSRRCRSCLCAQRCPVLHVLGDAGSGSCRKLLSSRLFHTPRALKHGKYDLGCYFRALEINVEPRMDADPFEITCIDDMAVSAMMSLVELLLLLLAELVEWVCPPPFLVSFR